MKFHSLPIFFGKTDVLFTIKIGLLLSVCTFVGCPSLRIPMSPVKPVEFKYYKWSTAGTTNRSHSDSIVFEGKIGDMKSDFHFRRQDQTGGSVVSDYNWQGVIDGNLQTDLQHIVTATKFGEISDKSLATGGSGSGVEVTLFYPNGQQQKGSPTNGQDWENLAQSIQQFVAKNKSQNNNDETVEFWQKQREKAMEDRGEPTGANAKGVNFLPELTDDGIIKQKQKFAELKSGGYKPPLDFVDLARLRADKTLVRVPFVTQNYVLDVGGAASDLPFTSFSFNTKGNQSTEIKPDSAEFKVLTDFATGLKLDLNNPTDRKRLRRELLISLHPVAKSFLEEIALSYKEKFNRPLIITALARSLEYQVDLQKRNSNVFRVVNNANSLPPHVSGCAFDIAYKQMTAEEQNFLAEKLADSEKAGKIDALLEGGATSGNAATSLFHVFVYFDGKPPQK